MSVNQEGTFSWRPGTFYMKIHEESAAGPFAKGAEISDLSNSSAIGCGISINQEGGDGSIRVKESSLRKKQERMSTKYPTTMSCREAFDQLTSCYSIGGQFRSYYRYGDFTSCDKQVSKFKFCIIHGNDPVKVQEWYKDQVSNNKALENTSGVIWQERETTANK